MQAPSYDPSYEDDLISESIDDNVNTSTIIQKRRGRRPKVKENEEVLTPKKRGRRPKDKNYTVINTYKDVSNDVEDENIILHLSIDANTVIENDSKIETSGVIQYDPDLKEPLPYEPLNSMISDYATILDKIETPQAENEVKYENVEKIDDNDVYIRDIGFEENNKNHFKVLKKAKILKMIASDETKNEWDMSTECCCFNCTEKFQTVPIGIPIRYFRNKFYCRDVFCSFNCAARFIFMGFDMRYQFKKWEYYSLLCFMSNKINMEINGNDNKNKIKIADDPKLLKKFGGPLSIEQYRDNFYILDSQHSIMYPPLACMYPQAEVAHYVNIHRQKAQMLNNDNRYNDYKQSLTDLKLRRDKPLIIKKNTLEEYMSLTIN